VKHNRPFIVLGMALLMVGFCAVTSAQVPPPAAGAGHSQAAAPQGMPFQIAVVDMAKLLFEHPTFVQTNNALMERDRVLTASWHATQDGFRARQAEIQQLTPGSREAISRSEVLVRERHAAETDLRIQQQHFEMEQARGLLAAYQHIQMAIAQYAQANRLALVIVHQPLSQEAREALDSGQLINPALVIDQQVVYHFPQLDITAPIQQMIQQSFQAAGSGAGQPLR